jgi:hypothetical protein
VTNHKTTRLRNQILVYAAMRRGHTTLRAIVANSALNSTRTVARAIDALANAGAVKRDKRGRVRLAVRHG